MLVLGEARGKPTVVLESGMGGGVGWEHTRDAIARLTQVVTYDRAGLGASQAGPAPRDAKTIARELHSALRNSGIDPPYLLVGQSLGGLYAQVFAADFPEDTAGLVLVDPTHADAAMCLSLNEVKAWYAAKEPTDWPRVEAALERSGPVELHSFLACKYKLMEEFLQTIPQPQQSEARREWWDMIDRILADRPPPAFDTGEHAEAKSLRDSVRQAIAARPLPKVPIILLAAGRVDLDGIPAKDASPNVRAIQAEAKRWKLAAFQKWIDETPGAKLIVVRNSGHDIESEKPQAVIDAVREVLLQTESGRKRPG